MLAPTEKAVVKSAGDFRVRGGEVGAFAGIGLEIVKTDAAALCFADEFPVIEPKAVKAHRVVGEENGGAFEFQKSRHTFERGRSGKPQQIANGRGEVDEAGDLPEARRFELAGRPKDEGHAYVLFVKVQGVPEIAGMLTERFAVVAVNNQQSVLKQAAACETLDQSSKGSVRVMERIEVAGFIIMLREWAIERRFIGMVSRNG